VLAALFSTLSLSLSQLSKALFPSAYNHELRGSILIACDFARVLLRHFQTLSKDDSRWKLGRKLDRWMHFKHSMEA
uniref:Uncharacterized protein n=1 Tax=Anopheles arabiensis TaxID=7173 RepID=A0A182IF57_ANOAR